MTKTQAILSKLLDAWDLVPDDALIPDELNTDLWEQARTVLTSETVKGCDLAGLSKCTGKVKIINNPNTGDDVQACDYHACFLNRLHSTSKPRTRDKHGSDKLSSP